MRIILKTFRGRKRAAEPGNGSVGSEAGSAEPFNFPAARLKLPEEASNFPKEPEAEFAESPNFSAEREAGSAERVNLPEEPSDFPRK